MKQFKSLMAVLLIVCLVFALTGCQKKDGNANEQPAPAAADTEKTETPTIDQNKTEAGTGEGAGGVADTSEAAEEEAAPEDVEEDGDVEIIVPDNMGTGDI